MRLSMRIYVATVAMLTVTTILRGECPDLSRPDITKLQKHVGHFYDSYWGFSVDIPDNLAGYSDPAPNPMHGFDIALPDAPPAIVYVLAYDKPVDTPLKTIEADQLLVLHSGGSVSRVLGPATSRVGGLAAARYDVTYKCSGNDPLQETFVIVENPGRRVFYRIGLYTHKSRRETDEKLFCRILSTWRAHPIKGTR